jgi:pyrroline-5-carboxylate reductase
MQWALHCAILGGMNSLRLGFVGAGNMASALLRGLLRAQRVSPQQIHVSDVDPAKREKCAQSHGVSAAASNQELCAWASVLLLAVKPQNLPGVLRECASAVQPGALVISIAAGVRSSKIGDALPDGTRIVRAMPNTPALVGAGATALCAGPRATPDDLEVARSLFDAVGRSVVVDETQMDAVTGLSGSGPAYVMLMIEALADGGVAAGLSRENALLLATQTVLGSAQLLLESGDHPAAWKDRVMSPGGTTAAGLAALEEGRLRHTLASAVQHATRRSRELGAG